MGKSLTDRLNGLADSLGGEDEDLIGEATVRIFMLERALRSIAANTCCGPCQEAALVAKSALKDDPQQVTV